MGPEDSRGKSRQTRDFIRRGLEVFADPLARIFPDEEHSVDELREIIIGHSESQQLILINFIEDDDRVRIISARKATPQGASRV